MSYIHPNFPVNLKPILPASKVESTELISSEVLIPSSQIPSIEFQSEDFIIHYSKLENFFKGDTIPFRVPGIGTI